MTTRQIVLAMAFVACLVLPPAQGDTDMSSWENASIAEFLYNASQFVTWPQHTKSTFTLCVIGNSTLGENLQQLAGKMMHGSAIEVSERTGLEDVHGCQLVFICQAIQAELEKGILRLAARPVLTVSDIDSFTDTGGMIGLDFPDNKLEFDINLEAVSHAGLAVSSRLVSLARNIKTREMAQQ